jgi:general secretion pathway protein D
MNIEQKDVLGGNELTPTFTERTMTGTARVQNNRTMMLASVSTDIESRGRRGIAFLGGLPFVGRFFTSPTRDVRQVDIVIAVTPRVLRAPAVTPRDEEMRPSGTLQSPTTGSLAEMIREADREDQIAAARSLPRNVVLQLPDAPLVKPGSETVSQNTTPANLPPPAGTFAFTSADPGKTVVNGTAANNATAPPVPVNNTTAPPVNTTATNKPVQAEELPSFVPAPKSLISDQAAANVATVNTGSAGTQNAVLTALPKATETSLAPKSEASLDAKPAASRVAQLSFLPAADVMKVGEKRRYAIQLNSDVPLSLALLALRFDPKVVKVHGVTAGSILPTTGDATALFTPLVDGTAGTCIVSISSLNGKVSFKGSGPLLFIELEAVGAGDAALSFVKETLHLVATDARDVVSEVVQGTATVKQQ